VKFIRFLRKGKVQNGIMVGENNLQLVKGDIFSEYFLVNEIIPLEEIKFLPPVVPSKIICVGLNYRQHAEELGLPIPENPILFLKPNTTILPHKGEIIYPSQSRSVDYEAELAIVIKSKCKNVSPEKATDVIFGYTCLNDVTARDLQKKDVQWTRAKSFDTFCPIGPCIETELDANHAFVRSYLNGELKQEGNTEDLIFGIAELVSFISSIMTLNKGDIIATGTPFGVGPMNKGDEIVIEVEGIGRLRNSVK